MILHNSLLFLATIIPLISSTPQNVTSPTSQNKAKRTIGDQVYSNGDGKAVVFYMESPQSEEVSELQASASSPGIKSFYAAPAKPLALVSVQQPIQVFEQDSPKEVAEQQVLYEFQQTPTNAVSNVHVKQLFQPSIELTTSTPLYQGQPSEQFPTSQPLASIYPATSIVTTNQNSGFSRSHPLALTGPSAHPATSATVISPVHHNIFTHHGQNSAAFNYNTSPISDNRQYQNTQVLPKQLPGKYIYLNGRIVYNPTQIVPQAKVTPNSIYHKGVYHNQQKLPLINYAQRNNQLQLQPQPIQQHSHSLPNGLHNGRPQDKLTPPAYVPPITNNRFKAPRELHQIDRPSGPIRQENTEEEEEQPENEEDDEGSEDDEEDAESKKEEEERDNNEEEDDSYGHEIFPFEEDDYHDDHYENHYFRPAKYSKNKSRSKKYQDGEEEYDHEKDDREDSRRDNSKQHLKRHYYPDQSRRNRNSPKYESGSENNGFYESYSSNTKYKMPKQGKKWSKKGKYEKPTVQYKKIKYSKNKGGKPKVETIEGRFSENIPVTHKQKVYKERWYVSKDLEGAASKKVNNVKI